MSTTVPTDAQAFYAYLGRSLQNGASETPPEAILRRWRAEKEYEEACEDIRQGMADIQAGRGRPLQEVASEIRRKLGLSE